MARRHQYRRFPGAAGGVSAKHPVGYNTTANRDADNGTTGPLASWGTDSDTTFSPANDGGLTSTSKQWGSGGANWTVYTVTDIVSDWASGSPNYGFYQVGNNYNWKTSESGSQYQPVLFIDYTPAPEPVTLALLALGGLAIVRRRGL